MILFNQACVALQIVTESLPISSSGHVALLQQLMFKKQEPLPESLYFLAHAPTLFICVLFFFNRLLSLATQVFTVAPQAQAIVLFFGITTFLTLLGFVLHKRCSFKLPLWACFLSTGIVLIAQSYAPMGAMDNYFALKHAFILGTVQALIFMPGLSRLAVTICVARWLGYSSYDAFTLSFLMLMPLLGGALLVTMMQNKTRTMLQELTARDKAVIVVSTIAAFFVLVLTAYLAYTDKLWILAFYMSIPVSIAWYKRRELKA